MGAARERTRADARARAGGRQPAGTEAAAPRPGRVAALVSWATVLAILALASLDPPSTAAVERPGQGPRLDPPTSSELRRATAGFLDSIAASSAGERGRSGAKASGTGGIDPDSPESGDEGSLLPESRVVALYGAPQLGATILGRKSPRQAARKLEKQATAYEGSNWRPVLGAFDLIAVIATASRGKDRLYRTRQDDEVIETYLDRARSVGARLVLDVQPGRARILSEVKSLRPWLTEPDVDLALDPEWNVGRKGVPGVDQGSVHARKINKVSKYLRRLVSKRDLPPKLLMVHQFHEGSVRKPRRIVQRANVAVTLNFDGIGSRAGKAAGYERLAEKRLFNGFSLFYRRDSGLMKPRQVVRLDPEPDFVLYQ